jgi:hypothetical protein
MATLVALVGGAEADFERENDNVGSGAGGGRLGGSDRMLTNRSNREA